MSTIAELLDEARPRGSSRQVCWRKRLDGKAQKVIEAAEAEGIKNFAFQGLARSLSKCGFEIAAKTVGDHYRNHKGRPCWTPSTTS